ncbi:MAG: hypothetical protein J6M10_03695 [Clostridia bacterium]|nr:hypothetical protein [Clostridia bacterium]
MQTQIPKGLAETLDNAPIQAEEALRIAGKKPVGVEEIRRAMQTLRRYKEGKARLDTRLIESEQWWKMRHWEWFENKGNPFNAKRHSAWLFNTIINKHADAIANYPQPNILPREEQDKELAATLSAVIPCILEQNGFEETYSDASWDKLKQGTCIYGTFWDGTKLNGLGDISIREIEPLNLFWEPGITDIQESSNVFHVELVDKDVLRRRYPQLEGKLDGTGFTLNKYLYDDRVNTEDKAPVVDWYYHSYDGARKVLQYCKFVGEELLYASENDTQPPTAVQMVQVDVDPETGMPVMEPREVPVGKSVVETGWYAHGEYPFVFDRLFPVKGSPFGFGYVDVCKHPQETIDLLDQAQTLNALMNAVPRYMMREDCGINEKEFADWRVPIVHVTGAMTDDNLRPITTPKLDGNVSAVIANKITEMKETSGNTDASNGVTNGVTSASGIAAQQQASGKTSRASNMSAYRAFGRVINQVIELMRQFYDAPRMFRILGNMGEERFISFDNRPMLPQAQGSDFGVDMGMRQPVFDIKVSAQSKNVYTQNAQNEMAQALYSMGVFNPQMTDQSLLLLDMMDFEGKDDVMAKVSRSGTVYQMYAQMSQVALGLAQQYGDAAAAESIAAVINQHGGGAMMPAGGAKTAPRSNTAADVQADPKTQGKEIAQVRKARESAQSAAEVRA